MKGVVNKSGGTSATAVKSTPLIYSELFILPVEAVTGVGEVKGQRTGIRK